MRRGDAIGNLKNQGQNNHSAKHPNSHDNPENLSKGEGGVGEQSKWDQGGLAHGALDEDEGGDTDHTRGVVGHSDGGGPSPLPALLGHNQQGNNAEDDRNSAPPVNFLWPGEMRNVKKRDHHDQRNDANRQIDEEHPAPAINPQDAIDARKQTAYQWADDARGPKNRKEISLILRPFFGRDDVSDNREG